VKAFDYRSEAAKDYRKLYGRKAWKDRRVHQLANQPLCEWCEKLGLTTAATVADHVVPHRGDLDLFHHGELQSLCAPCHDAGKARQERGGYDSACDLDGYPIDPEHPANRSGLK
jgi:5-methylcytosine-specific restriction enzyme A